MSVFNSGSTPHRQHFYGDSILDAPTSAYKGDLFHELTGDKLDYIFNGTTWEPDNPVLTKFFGSIPEYAWLDGAEAPTPTEAFAWGYKFNVATGVVTAYGWSGSVWVEVV